MDSESNVLRENILNTIDSFLDKIQNLRAILIGVSLSALILAPFAIGISVYLVTHPTFLMIIEHERDFGFMLIVLIVGILVISGLWLAVGIRQYRSLSDWNKRYCGYLKKKEELDKTISSQYNLDENQ
jgi:predicted PurR-regulated permease PerM